MRTRSPDRLRARQQLARARQTVRACIDDLVREGRELGATAVLREWQEWGCPYARPYALGIAQSVLDEYYREIARDTEVCA